MTIKLYTSSCSLIDFDRVKKNHRFLKILSNLLKKQNYFCIETSLSIKRQEATLKSK